MYKNQLINQNPWWKNPKAIDEDIKLFEVSRQKIIYEPDLIKQLDIYRPGIYTLRGPRQVGKSVLIKLLLRRLLQRENIKPSRIMFYSSEDLENYKDLVAVIESFFSMSSSAGSEPAGLYYVFIDEVSFIKNWERGIKKLYENGTLRNAFVLLSGSNAYDLHHQAEKLPGRRGEDPYPDKVYLPLSFRQMVALLNKEIAVILPNLSLQEVFDAPARLAELQTVERYRNELVRIADIYFMTGGFLKVIDSFMRDEKIEQYLYETYLQWIRGDMVKLKRSEKTAREILAELIERQVSRIDWQNIARKTNIDSHKTVSDYVALLEDFFILKVLYQIDLGKGQPRIKKMKKAYFIDNFILWAIWGWSEKLLNTYNFTREKMYFLLPQLIETFAASVLFRVDKNDWLNSRVFFWHGEKEIDFIIKDASGSLFPVEVKAQSRLDEKDFLPMAKRGFKKGLIVSRDHFFNTEDFFAVPYYLFGLLNS
jgi:predicted AAA+ superfamily ATPase